MPASQNCHICGASIGNANYPHRARSGENSAPVLVCDACIESNCGVCTECRCYTDSLWITDGMCPSCYYSHTDEEDDDEDDEPVQEVNSWHGDRVRSSWPSPEPGCWGIEIEIHATNRRATVVAANSCGWAAERDGSLSEANGVELVSPPLQYPDLETRVNELISSLPRGCTGWSQGKGRESGYGIHVSFDTRRTSKLTLWRFARLMNQNPLGLCEFAAGRASNSWARFYPETTRETVSDALRQKGKYSAVNLESPPRCEIRIFRSTLAAESVLACMEFTRACLDYARDRIPSLNDYDLAMDFWKFVESDPKRYANFRRRTARMSRTRLANRHYGSLIATMPPSYARLGIQAPQLVEVEE